MENKKPKILHFEDESLFREICRLRFLGNNFDYKGFGTYENFLEIVVGEKPDLIICDILIPGINGYEAIKMLKADERTKNIPFIFLTNLSTEQEVQKGLEMGASKYLYKQQFSPDGIVEEIKEILEKQKN
jgi:CheY-like chemotaxis protein